MSDVLTCDSHKCDSAAFVYVLWLQLSQSYGKTWCHVKTCFQAELMPSVGGMVYVTLWLSCLHQTWRTSSLRTASTCCSVRLLLQSTTHPGNLTLLQLTLTFNIFCWLLFEICASCFYSCHTHTHLERSFSRETWVTWLPRWFLFYIDPILSVLTAQARTP